MRGNRLAQARKNKNGITRAPNLVAAAQRGMPYFRRSGLLAGNRGGTVKGSSHAEIVCSACSGCHADGTRADPAVGEKGPSPQKTASRRPSRNKRKLLPRRHTRTRSMASPNRRAPTPGLKCAEQTGGSHHSPGWKSLTAPWRRAMLYTFPSCHCFPPPLPAACQSPPGLRSR